VHVTVLAPGDRMDLKARLQRADALRQGAPTQPAPARTHHHPPLEDLVAGRWEALDGGRCFVAEERYALAFRHGDLALEEVLGVPERVWQAAATGTDRRPFAMRRAVFVDIETTGLARGGGTYAFLVGVGAFQGEEFVLRQFFMPHYADEDALLALLEGALRDHGGLVTFNGRSFDWPIIETRYILSRREPPGDGSPHLDLLHLARRLWRRSLPSCALSSLEQHVLQIARSASDVPGYLIPALYQDYLERGATGPLADVFYHNLIDILSLVTLAARAGGAVADPLSTQGPAPCDLCSLAGLLEADGRTEEALRTYRRAAEGEGPQAVEAARRLGVLLKRLERHDEAAAVWRAEIPRGGLAPYVELAKHLEHRQKDYAGAREVVAQAIAWAGSPAAGLGRWEARRVLRDLEHRLGRLDRRLDAGASEKD
jgi:uncharacterized protein YprB with RNaseH-like and TPR domain